MRKNTCRSLYVSTGSLKLYLFARIGTEFHQIPFRSLKLSNVESGYWLVLDEWSIDRLGNHVIPALPSFSQTGFGKLINGSRRKKKTLIRIQFPILSCLLESDFRISILSLRRYVLFFAVFFHDQTIKSTTLIDFIQNNNKIYTHHFLNELHIYQ